ncbi:N-acetyltransferase eco [Histomonas meleagridis]|uniref:N-acetyltransferase eco n=1 Tax=Histomonas meleagridis TaxID=135588 RepID=UPI003559CA30|nr:N-acetyltransferase eco [Histomonas meleagridis]KAH0803424.1 N-acetyltransferase eco [Histomonas meleagridis]
MEGDISVLQVNENSPNNVKKFVTQIIERSSNDLGESPPLPKGWTCYLALQKPFIIGYCLIERNVEGFLLEDSTRKVICPLGIARFWVSPKHRRKGVATLLVDAARQTEKSNIPKCMVCFSEPTDLGMSFAKKYCGTNPFVYCLKINE